jgi:hypothetical protein
MANPAWLDALLAQAYPGTSTDMSQFPGTAQFGGNAQGRQGGAEINAPLSPWNTNMPGQNMRGAGPGGIGSDVQMPSVNVDERLLPAAPASANVRNPYSPPVPSPNRVGGAPSPGIPAPQRMNRTANNPNFTTFQYQVPNSSGGRAPIYTAANFGGSQTTAPTPQGPQGPLAAPQGSGGGYNVNNLFANLPDDIFDQGSQSAPTRGPMPPAAVAQLMQHHPGYVSASPDQLSTYMKNNPWVQNLGG